MNFKAKYLSLSPNHGNIAGEKLNVTHLRVTASQLNILLYLIVKPSHEKAASIFLKITSLLGYSSLDSCRMPFDSRSDTNQVNPGTCHAVLPQNEELFEHSSGRTPDSGLTATNNQADCASAKEAVEAHVGHFCKQERALTASDLKQGASLVTQW